MRVQSSMGQTHRKKDRSERNGTGNKPAGEPNKHETLETEVGEKREAKRKVSGW